MSLCSGGAPSGPTAGRPPAWLRNLPGGAPFLFLLLSASGLLGQDQLTLKRDSPPEPADPCAVAEHGTLSLAPPSAADAASAEQRVAEASQASILGDRDRARTLLLEAAELDPSSPTIRYRLGRLMEDAGREPEAVSHYCRYLAISPDGPEADEVEERIDQVGNGLAGRGDAADAAFREGIRAFEEGEYEVAARHFSEAVELLPEWEDARFNRGLAHHRAGDAEAGAADFRRYLELRPDARDRELVEAQLRPARPGPASVYGPATVLVTGMLMPGMGHVYAGAPQTGILVLAAAAGSAGAALLYRKIVVECLSLPVDGECPPGEERGREETRPLRTPGLVMAAAITIGGAVHAYLMARDSNVRLSAEGGLEAPLARLHTGGAEAMLILEPGGRAGGQLHAGVRVRFR